MTLHDDGPVPHLSRRGALTAAARIVTFAAATWVAGRAGVARAQQEKISQSAADYQDHPKASKACAACTHFQPPNACHMVAGTISPNGWCKYFAPKEGG